MEKYSILDVGPVILGAAFDCIVKTGSELELTFSVDRLRTANLKYSERGWRYLCARGENIPLPDASIHGVLSAFHVCWLNCIECWYPEAGSEPHYIHRASRGTNSVKLFLARNLFFVSLSW